MTEPFLGPPRLLAGPPAAFERDVARLMMLNGFDHVRLIGGTGDRGGDILGSKGGQLWVFQCKHTGSTPPPPAAVDEVVEAGRVYRADRLVVACSRPPGEGLASRVTHWQRLGTKVEVVGPAALMELMAKSPVYHPSRPELRTYQREAADALRDALIDTGRGQIVLATGLGKTVVMATVVDELLEEGLVKEGRVLVLAHTNAIVDQLQVAFWRHLPRYVPTHKLADGEVPTFWEGVTFATIQSVKAREDQLPSFGLVLVDEAHHIGAPMFREYLDRNLPPMVGGVTATPWRGDGFDINSILGEPLVRIGIAEGLRQGFLTDVDYRLLADNLDWTMVQRLSKYRYSIGELNRKLIIPTRDEEAANQVRRAFVDHKRRGGVVFSPTIAHAREFASALRHAGLRATHISSDMTIVDREILMTQFRAGEWDIVTSVDVFNEGVDVPDVDLLVFMRATHSRRIFVQQVGRGLRISPGKDKVIILDFVTDLRRVAEVLELDRSVRDGRLERVGLGPGLVSFSNESAGSFLREWMLDQADLLNREDDPKLVPPEFEFPRPAPPGGVQ